MFYLCCKRLYLIFVIFFGINGIFRWNLLNLTIGFEMIFFYKIMYNEQFLQFLLLFALIDFHISRKKKKTTITETNPNESILEKWNERFHNNCAKAWPEEIKINRFTTEFKKTFYIQNGTTLWWSDIMLLVCLCSMCEFGWSRCISLLFIS